MDINPDAWRNKRVLVTGHTGFKGSWLVFLLKELGAEVIGLSLPAPESRPSLYIDAEIGKLISSEYFLDIRDEIGVKKAIQESIPDYVFHLAAQAFVPRSLNYPSESITTNVAGTANVLLASLSVDSIQGITIATTDKVYENIGIHEPFKETDRLGSKDPYSASKASAELIVASLSSTCNPYNIPGTTVRAGNVIGGGDWGEDRLVPDLVLALNSDQTLSIRNLNATRPWQHVLDCLNGYTTLAEAMLENPWQFEAGSTWNFGPDISSFVSVGEVTTLASSMWGQEISWDQTPDPEFHEAGLLALDASKAQTQLSWENILPFEAAIDWTVSWYRQVGLGAMLPGEAMASQLEAFSNLSSGSQLYSVGNGLS